MPTVIPPVMPMQVLPALPMGKAAALLQLLDVPKANFIITDRCNIACAHCFAPRGVGELNHALIMRTVDELKGLPNVYFSGGEPFQHSAGQQAFLSLLHYTAARVGRVNIATNGAFVPENEADARSLLAEFPPNTTFILSADDFYADALAKTGRSLEQVSRTLFDVTQSMGLGLEMFVRQSDGFQGRKPKQMVSDEVPADILLELSGKDLVHGNRVLRQNSARALPREETQYLSIHDFIRHSQKLSKLGIFMMQDGAVTDNSHVAYMKARPPFTILGNLNDSSLYDILLTRLLPGHFGSETSRRHSRRTIESRARVESGDAFTKEEIASIVDSAMSPAMPVTWDEVRKIVFDTNGEAFWHMGLDFKVLFQLLDRDDFRRLFKETMAYYISYLFSFPYPDTSDRTIGYRYVVEHGVASIEWRHGRYGWTYPDQMFELELYPALEELEQVEGFDPAIIREDFLQPLYEALNGKHRLRDLPYGKYLCELLKQTREKLGIPYEPTRIERIKSWLGETFI